MNEGMPSAAEFTGSELTGLHQEHRFRIKPTKHFPAFNARLTQYFSDVANPTQHFQTRINGKSYFVRCTDEPTTRKEVAAAKIGSALYKINVLPVVTFWQADKHFIAMPMLKGDHLMKHFVYKEEVLGGVDDDYIKRALVFDWIIGMADRHIGNVLRASDGKLYLIDHKRAFYAEPSHVPHGNVLRLWLEWQKRLNHPIEPDFQAKAIAVAESFEPYIEENGLDVVAFLERIEKLKSANKFSGLSHTTNL